MTHCDVAISSLERKTHKINRASALLCVHFLFVLCCFLCFCCVIYKCICTDSKVIYVFTCCQILFGVKCNVKFCSKRFTLLLSLLLILFCAKFPFLSSRFFPSYHFEGYFYISYLRRFMKKMLTLFIAFSII